MVYSEVIGNQGTASIPCSVTPPPKGGVAFNCESCKSAITYLSVKSFQMRKKETKNPSLYNLHTHILSNKCLRF